jgi:lipid II isoglutaminyl synthase (glutamine-hydrolysing)
MRPLRLVWVYPDLLSTYGDRGNVLVLERRARLRGLPVEVIEVNSDQQVPRDGDIYLMGGGEDLPQTLATRRLQADGGLHAAAERGAVVFAVCAGYQMIGVEFGGADDTPVRGLGLLDIRSGRGERRAVGEIVADVDPGLNVGRLTGFENHQGVTRLGPGVRPLARTEIGTGNGDGTEGSYAGRVLGTYLHGPALVRNPNLADLLLFWAVGPLPPFPPQAEELANRLRAERLAAAVPQLSSGGRPLVPPSATTCPAALVHEGLGVVRDHLGDEGRRAGDPDARDDVRGRDVPAGGALAAYGHRAERQHRGEQVGQWRRMRQGEAVGPPGQREPRCLAGQPQRDRHAACHRRRGHRERLIAPLGLVRAGRDLNHEVPCHEGNSSPTGAPAGANRAPATTLACHARDAQRDDLDHRLRCGRHRRGLRGGQGDPWRPA